MKGFVAIVALCLATGNSAACSCSRSHANVDAGADASTALRGPDKKLTRRLDGAIRRATDYIRTHADTFDRRLAMVLAYPQRKFAPPGLPPMAARAETNETNEGAKEFEHRFRRMIHPEFTADRASIDTQVTEIDRTTATALYCDRLDHPEKLLPMLTTLTERDDEYSLPHAMMATGWALENGCIAEDVGQILRDRQVELVEERMARNRQSITSDVLIECVLFLYYANRRSHVKDEWIDAVIDAQLPSGGWADKLEAEDDHTTALAYWLLLEARHPEAPPLNWIPRGGDPAPPLDAGAAR